MKLLDLRVVWETALSRRGATSHRDLMEQVYARQAQIYDHTRDGILHDRQALLDALPFAKDLIWADIGAGTGQSIERIGVRAHELKHTYLFDVCPSLLDEARKRKKRHSWKQVSIVEVDIAATKPAIHLQVDILSFSYSLSMMGNWRQALDHAYQMMKPGAVIGVVDFYLPRRSSGFAGMLKYLVAKYFWRNWFAVAHVHLDRERLAYLREKFAGISLEEKTARISYLPVLPCPYFIFIGRKPV